MPAASFQVRRSLAGAPRGCRKNGARRVSAGVSGEKLSQRRQDAKGRTRIPGSSWRLRVLARGISGLGSAPHAPEQLVLVPSAEPQHLAGAQLHFVIALEQGRECLDRSDIHRGGLVDARELLVAKLL